MSSMGGGGGGGGGMSGGGYAQIAGGLIGGAGSILSMLGSQKHKRIKTQSSTAPEFTPEGQAVQDALLRMLFTRLAQTPQSFADYQAQGPRQQFTPSMVTPMERDTLGLGQSAIPQGVNPFVVQALQYLGYAPTGAFGPGPGTPGAPVPTSSQPMTGMRS